MFFFSFFPKKKKGVILYCRYCLSTMDVKSHTSDSKSGATKNQFTRKELKTKIQQCKDWAQIATLFKIDTEATRPIPLAELLPNIRPHPVVVSE